MDGEPDKSKRYPKMAKQSNKDATPEKSAGEGTGDVYDRHISERQMLQDTHETDTKAMHERHIGEHKEMADRHRKDGRDGKAHAQERHQMHHRHMAERHSHRGNHAVAHAEMAARQAADLRDQSAGAASPGQPSPNAAAASPTTAQPMT